MRNFIKTTLLLSSLTFIFCLSSCKEEKNITPLKVEFKKEGELSLYKTTATDTFVKKFDIEIAKTDYEIQTGLMYRDSMKENQGMLFVFPEVRNRSFYMKNTRIPLDLIFFDHNKRVVSFQENAKPLDLKPLLSNTPAQFVLEVNAGMAQQLLLDVGDKMDYFEYLIVK